MKGKFITFEGGEGSGKSTVIRKLTRQIEAKGYNVFTTQEPGGTPTGEAIRGILQHETTGEEIYPTTELLLFEASRAQLVGTIIKPRLENGIWVLSDRFMDSTTAYQGYARGFGYEQVEMLNSFAIGDCVPDLTILLNVSTEVGLSRINLRGRVLDRMEREKREFHEKVRVGYLDIAKRYSERFVVINADQDPDEVYRITYLALTEKLKI